MHPFDLTDIWLSSSELQCSKWCWTYKMFERGYLSMHILIKRLFLFFLFEITCAIQLLGPAEYLICMPFYGGTVFLCNRGEILPSMVLCIAIFIGQTEPSLWGNRQKKIEHRAKLCKINRKKNMIRITQYIITVTFNVCDMPLSKNSFCHSCESLET